MKEFLAWKCEILQKELLHSGIDVEVWGYVWELHVMLHFVAYRQRNVGH